MTQFNNEINWLALTPDEHNVDKILAEKKQRKQPKVSSKADPAIKDGKDIRSAIRFERQDVGTFVIALIVGKNKIHNEVQKVTTKQGMPIGGYAFDHVNDTYLIKCVDQMQVGIVPVAYKMTMPNVGHWSVPVPLPENVLRRYLSTGQRNEIRRFKRAWPVSDYELHFLQLVSFK